MAEQSQDIGEKKAIPVPDLGFENDSLRQAMLERRILWNRKAPSLSPDTDEEKYGVNPNIRAISQATGLTTGEINALAEDDKWDARNALTPIAYMAYLARHETAKMRLSDLERLGMPREICNKLAEYRDQIAPKDYLTFGRASDQTDIELNR